MIFSNDTYMDSLRVDYFTGVSTGTNTTIKKLKLQAIEDLVVQLNVNIKTDTKYITKETNNNLTLYFSIILMQLQMVIFPIYFHRTKIK